MDEQFNKSGLVYHGTDGTRGTFGTLLTRFYA
jgi:hypothetical protein